MSQSLRADDVYTGHEAKLLTLREPDDFGNAAKWQNTGSSASAKPMFQT